MTDIDRLEALAFRAGFLRGVSVALENAERHPEHRLKRWALEVAEWGESRFIGEPPPELLVGGETLQ